MGSRRFFVSLLAALIAVLTPIFIGAAPSSAEPSVTLAAAGSLAAAPLEAAVGADVVEKTTMTAETPASATSMAAVRGDRVRNGRIAFQAYVHRTPEVFTIQPNGNDKQLLTRNEMYNNIPDWSPSGRRIVFGRETPNDGFELFTMRADGTDKQRLTHDPFLAIYPAWSPAGHRIAYGCFDGEDFEICTIRRDGTDKKQLTDNDVVDNHADWSSRRRIAYDSWDGADEEIYTIKPHGGDIQQVTHNATDDFGPSFSPSGRRVAFAGDEIYIKPLNGGPRFRVTHTRNRVGDMPSWSPNGRRISFVLTSRAGNPDIYTIRTTGEDRHRVTDTVQVEEATAWGARPKTR